MPNALSLCSLFWRHLCSTGDVVFFAIWIIARWWILRVLHITLTFSKSPEIIARAYELFHSDLILRRLIYSLLIPFYFSGLSLTVLDAFNRSLPLNTHANFLLFITYAGISSQLLATTQRTPSSSNYIHANIIANSIQIDTSAYIKVMIYVMIFGICDIQSPC